MIRSVGTALVGAAVLAALAGCASQEPFGLPELTPRGSTPSIQVYPNYGSGYGNGYGYGYGYPSGYRPGYRYGYADPYYAAQGPYPYAYGYGYNPYPRYVVVPCADNNRDGRCDSPPPKDHEHQGGGHHDNHEGDHDRDDQPVRQRDARGVVPAPVVQQPARVRPEPRHAIPPDATTPRGPRTGKGHQPMTGDDVVQSSPTQEP